ncbi:hypothetical protein M0805_004138 [Coniferiporia weirii]|nr:hypothetical protein M0805_004138 [Coniferiporia weirii]
MDSDVDHPTIRIELEVCVDSVESALAAVEGGADRLEVCASVALAGGTTPSSGLFTCIKHAVPPHVELMAMVRPRTGDFLYSPSELAVMHADIASFAHLGASGVVFGALRPDGTVDGPATRALVGAAVACGMEVCFHRAFDMVTDQREALATLASIHGITRILTSGGAPTAPQGLPSLLHLSLSPSLTTTPPTDTRGTTQPKLLTLMPGSGVSPHTAAPLLRALLPHGVRALHLSGGAWLDSDSVSAVDPDPDADTDVRGGMHHRPEGMGMGDWRVWRTRVDTVRVVRTAVDAEAATYAAQQHRTEPDRDREN